jgi:hypothetical protein
MKITKTYEELAAYTGVSIDTLIRCPHYKVMDLYNAMVEYEKAEIKLSQQITLVNNFAKKP